MAGGDRIDQDQVAGGPESTVETGCQAAAFEQGQGRQDARDRPTGRRDELIDRRPPEHELASDPARRGPTSASVAAALLGTPGSVR